MLVSNSSLKFEFSCEVQFWSILQKFFFDLKAFCLFDRHLSEFQEHWSLHLIYFAWSVGKKLIICFCSNHCRTYYLSVAASFRCWRHRALFVNVFSSKRIWLLLGRPAMSHSLCFFLLACFSSLTFGKALFLNTVCLMKLLGTMLSAVLWRMDKVGWLFRSHHSWSSYKLLLSGKVSFLYSFLVSFFS